VRRAALAGGGIAIVLAVGVALGWWRQGRSLSPPVRALTSSVSLSTQTSAFGDPLTAQLDLLVDPRRIDPASVRVRPRFSPYRTVSATVRVRSAGGVLLSYRYELECLAPACVPDRAPSERSFPAAALSYRIRGGSLERTAVEWPRHTIVSRLSAPVLGDPIAQLKADAPPAAVSYRVDPGMLRALLAALSAVLVLGGATLVVLALPVRSRRVVDLDLPPLERALRLVRASASNGYPDERRKALGGLGRELRTCGRTDLALDAARLAWSAEPPSATAASRFADDVEAAL
jgi:hypothetical protein